MVKLFTLFIILSWHKTILSSEAFKTHLCCHLTNVITLLTQLFSSSCCLTNASLLLHVCLLLHCANHLFANFFSRVLSVFLCVAVVCLFFPVLLLSIICCLIFFVVAAATNEVERGQSVLRSLPPVPLSFLASFLPTFLPALSMLPRSYQISDFSTLSAVMRMFSMVTFTNVQILLLNNLNDLLLCAYKLNRVNIFEI